VQVLPVGLRLDAGPLDWSRLALDAEQPLDDTHVIARSVVACRTPSVSCSNASCGVWTPMMISPSSR
jgi:hypothetical protein